MMGSCISKKSVNKSGSDKESSKMEGIVPASFTKAAGKWVTEFNAGKDTKELTKSHYSISAYDEEGVFSVSNPAGDVHYTAKGLTEIQQQWHTIRTAFGAVQVANPEGHKVRMINETMLIQSFDHLDLCDKEGKVVMSINILAEVWKLKQGKWYVMADYVMVKPASGKCKVPKSFTEAAGKWVTEFNAGVSKKELTKSHYSISAYDKEGVFSVSHPKAGVHYTAKGLTEIQEQWHTIRTAFGAVQVANPEGHRVQMLNDKMLIQSFDHLDLCDKDGKVVMSINILAEVWKLNDEGKWVVMADYVMVKP